MVHLYSHRRRKVLNIGEGGKLFAGCLLIKEPYPLFRLLSVPNKYISHIKTVKLAKLRIELKSIVLAIPSNFK